MGYLAGPMLEAIPYLDMPAYEITRLPVIGPLKLQVFGPLVAVGVILGYHRCLAYAKKKDIDEFVARDLMFYVLVTGFIISHWVSVLFYFPSDVRDNPLVLLMIWNGLSSVGGFFGALVGFFWYLRRQKQPYLVFLDMLCFGLLVGFTLGRLGCALVHDHPGIQVEATHPLAVGPWPTGEYRLDNGLLEFCYLTPIVLFIHFVYNWGKAAPGRLIGLVCLLYAPFRFTLDFMRVKDLTYLGLTTAHYATMLIFAAGVYLVFLRKPRASDLEWAKDSERIAQEKAAAEKTAAEKAAKAAG